MEQRETQGLLLSLLEDSGVPFQNEQGLVRFRFRQQGMVWETACRCQKDQVVAYGRYPFPVEKEKALGLCNQFNQQLAQGSFFEQQARWSTATGQICKTPTTPASGWQGGWSKTQASSSVIGAVSAKRPSSSEPRASGA